MHLTHPHSSTIRAARDRMLQSTLRPPETPFAIGAEYPLVLGEDGACFSYCLMDHDQVVAHANLWPRRLVDRERGREHRIGLVGNVATVETRQGQGLMRRVMDEVKERAMGWGLQALVLWSDLTEFYQKLGFASYGLERRYLARTRLLPASSGWVANEGPATAELVRLMEARLAVSATLARSGDEFQRLLTIPGTNLWTQPDLGAYAVMGKGMDMINVVHEWGAPNPEAVLGAMGAAGRARGFEHVMLLAPRALPEGWHETLALASDGVEEHPMALVWSPKGEAEAREALGRGFIWGLDSI